MIRAVFIQGAIGTALFAPLAVLVLGKWREAKIAVGLPPPVQMRATSVAWKLALLVAAFVFLLHVFWLFCRVAESRTSALLVVTFMYPLIRMLRVGRCDQPSPLRCSRRPGPPRCYCPTR